MNKEEAIKFRCYYYMPFRGTAEDFKTYKNNLQVSYLFEVTYLTDTHEMIIKDFFGDTISKTKVVDIPEEQDLSKINSKILYKNKFGYVFRVIEENQKYEPVWIRCGNEACALRVD